MNNTHASWDDLNAAVANMLDAVTHLTARHVSLAVGLDIFMTLAVKSNSKEWTVGRYAHRNGDPFLQYSTKYEGVTIFVSTDEMPQGVDVQDDTTRLFMEYGPCPDCLTPTAVVTDDPGASRFVLALFGVTSAEAY